MCAKKLALIFTQIQHIHTHLRNHTNLNISVYIICCGCGIIHDLIQYNIQYTIVMCDNLAAGAHTIKNGGQECK